MKKKKVIKILKNELWHTREHLRFKDMEKEYYKELKEYEKAINIAIKAVKKNVS